MPHEVNLMMKIILYMSTGTLQHLVGYIIIKYIYYSFCCTGDFSLPDIDWESESIHSHR